MRSIFDGYPRGYLTLFLVHAEFINMNNQNEQKTSIHITSYSFGIFFHFSDSSIYSEYVLTVHVILIQFLK